MSRFFNPEAAGDDARLHAPATARNREAILNVLQEHLPQEGSLLEVASGTGEHASFFAPHFPNIDWQPTDIDENHLASIAAWRAHTACPSLLSPMRFDVLTDDWALPHLEKPLTAILAINLIHISPFDVTVALMENTGRTLGSGGVLFLYGPYRRGGAHTAPSNESFDASLKARNPAWGVRDMEEVISLAGQNGFGAPEIVPMPANNFSLVFKK